MKTKIAILACIGCMSMNAQNTIPSTVVDGDLQVKGTFELEDYQIKYFPAEGSIPQLLTFFPKTSMVTPGTNFKQPCNILYPPANPNDTFPVSYNFLASTAFPDLMQVFGQNNSNSVLSMAVANNDGIIAVEPMPNHTGSSKLRINPGCTADVEICEGGGYTKIFNDAGVLGKLRIGQGSAPVTPAQVDVVLASGVTSALRVVDPVLTGTNKNIFAVSNTGKASFGNQSSAPNSAMININVPGTGDAIDVFSQSSNAVNFRVKANGFVYARELNVQLSGFPDYVFDKEYKLMSLSEVDAYIKKNHHLPGIPAAAEIDKNGANLGEITRLQMEKIEELTLYVIQLKQEIEALKKQTN